MALGEEGGNLVPVWGAHRTLTSNPLAMAHFLPWPSPKAKGRKSSSHPFSYAQTQQLEWNKVPSHQSGLPHWGWVTPTALGSYVVGGVSRSSPGAQRKTQKVGDGTAESCSSGGHKGDLLSWESNGYSPSFKEIWSPGELTWSKVIERPPYHDWAKKQKIWSILVTDVCKVPVEHRVTRYRGKSSLQRSSSMGLEHTT